MCQSRCVLKEQPHAESAISTHFAHFGGTKIFLLRWRRQSLGYVSLIEHKREVQLNSELCRKALEKVVNPNILVNLISKRVRQLTSGGTGGRPLISETAGLGTADIALIEIIESKMGHELAEDNPLLEPVRKKGKRG
jgi:DNA-directed RNA polymerase subunit omega